ncbi:MAG TPA: hypothetical protein VMK16_19515 [Acidimicrobiales bacterium]|nr:hypothetical protein [Acidimicrobiales bacterium]
MDPSGADDGSGALSALPSSGARALAFISILIGGLCGGLIGYGFVDLQCSGDCGTAAAIGALIGAVIAAGGTAVIAVLVLRAMGEWRQIQAERRDDLPE